MNQTKKEYQDFYNKVGSLIGWDFSNLQYTSDGVEWELYDILKQKCKETDVLLDIGTGGGERILEISSKFKFVFGIDISPNMIRTAKKNQINSDISNVRFFEMDAEKINFPDEMFNVITCRHSDFFPNEIYRLLEKGGSFLTQQVGEADKLNLKKAFERGQSFGIEDGSAMKEYVQNLQTVGFSQIKTYEYNAIEYYSRAEDLIFLLKHTPIIEHFGVEKEDFTILEKFIDKNTRNKGIQTNSKRYMIIAEK